MAVNTQKTVFYSLLIVFAGLLYLSVNFVWANLFTVYLFLSLGYITKKKRPLKNGYTSLPAVFFFFAFVASNLLGAEPTKKIHVVQNYLLDGKIVEEKSEEYDEDGISFPTTEYNFKPAANVKNWQLVIVAIITVMVTLFAWFYSVGSLMTLKS